jgi:NADH-quinone oxidoreductase subunit I
MAIKVLKQKPLSTVEKTYIPGLLTGLWVTFKNIFRKSVTLEYPEKRPELPSHYRGMPVLVKNPEGRVKCVSCQLCEFVCPPKAIRIKPGPIAEDSENANIEKAPQEFEIDMLRCIYCGLCEEVCPEEAIFLKDVFALNGLSRAELVFQKEKLLELGGVMEDRHRKWEKKREASLNSR